MKSPVVHVMLYKRFSNIVVDIFNNVVAHPIQSFKLRRTDGTYCRVAIWKRWVRIKMNVFAFFRIEIILKRAGRTIARSGGSGRCCCRRWCFALTYFDFRWRRWNNAVRACSAVTLATIRFLLATDVYQNLIFNFSWLVQVNFRIEQRHPGTKRVF